MAMVAHDPKAAKRLGIPQKVGKDYVEADKGRKFGSGGTMKESKQMMKKEVSFMKKKGAPKSMIKHEEAEMEGKKVRKFAVGGVSYADRVAQLRGESDKKRLEARAQRDAAKAPSEKILAMRAATDAKVASQRQASDAAYAARQAARKAPPPILPPSEERLTPMPPPKLPGFDLPSPGRGAPITPPPGGLPDNTQAMMRKGGSVKKYARGGGIESKGKTRGHIVKMASGGHVGSASKRADGIASKGKTRGKMC